MFQFIPALILLLLQSQGYANRLGSDQTVSSLLTTGHCQRLIQPGTKANIAVRRAFLVRLLSETKNDPQLVGKILELLEAIAVPSLQAAGSQSDAEIARRSIDREVFESWRTRALETSQRLRDGPGPIV